MFEIDSSAIEIKSNCLMLEKFLIIIFSNGMRLYDKIIL